MGERLIKPYEISVWEDKLTQNGFIENKLAVIGSDTMTGLNKVYDPVFNKKSNGEKTLSFSLKYKYFDPYSGNSDYINPFAALLTNERKVKLHYDGQWYEFIVKEHTESSDESTWTYNCIDAFVLELSKNGYNITFDSELNNNQGTARELVEKTLKDTDWQLGGAQVGRQLVEEPIYKATLLTTTGITIVNTDETEETVTGGTQIYLFYSYVKNQNGKYVQFIIRDENRSYFIDDKKVITDTNFRIIDELEYKNTGFYKGDTPIIAVSGIETEYQAKRLVYNQRTTYDPVKQRTVDIFKVNDREIYRYTDYTYTTSNVVMNYITNGDNFNVLEDGSLQGWNPYVDFTKQSSSDTIDKLELVTRPELGTGKTLADIDVLSQIEGFLKARFKGALTSGYKNAIYNSGFENNASLIESVSVGQEFVFRWRAGIRNPEETNVNKSDVDCLVPYQNLRLLVAKYTRDNPTPYGYYYRYIDPANIILQFDGTPIELNNYIRGGSLVADTSRPGPQSGTNYYNYVIDGVVQTPSTKYIYVDKDTNNEYVWDGTTGNFAYRTNANYRPYYYLKAAARKAITNSELSDVTQKIGIFIYIKDNKSPVYIQDIQLTRYFADGESDTPILIGNTPTATTKANSYYYLKPSEGTAAKDVQTYTSLTELASYLNVQSTDIYPVYNEDSEKILTISASKSNCFNILQTIAETFECWVDLVVDHDEYGYITYTDGKPNKFVYLKEYAGKDNWAGFKYGVNLQSIERTVNSDEIVTKLLVDLSQSDYVDEGFVSIANAPSNQSGESYIINFDYYYNQGLLNREEAEPNRLQFIEAIANINKQLNAKEKERRDLEAALTSLGGNRTAFTEVIDAAKDMQSEALAEFYQLTGETYQSYRTKHTNLLEERQLTEEETIYDILGRLYTSSATINNYSGLLTNKEQEYWEIRKRLRGSENYYITFWTEEDSNGEPHVIIELDDYLPGLQFRLGVSYVDVFTISQKYFDISSEETTITFTPLEGYNFEPNNNSYTITSSPQIIKVVNTETLEGVEDVIKELQKEKDDLVNNFNNKYRRFIQEGTWNSTEYIDSELYYLDALQVSNTSAQPTVSYTINVVEISELEGFEWYLFDAGDKTYVEDTEFFGWANVDGYLTPAREEVIVSEVEWHLDEPDQNIITVQNYKTRFEDLFQRISAAVQTVQYNEATYAKISTLLDSNGSINQDVLLESLNRISGQEYNLTSDGSVLINGDQILVQNLTNPANRVIINSEGIRVSSDGGQTWRTAIDGQGINIGAVYTGTLNTNNVIIGSSDNPSFRWDKSGISAYKSEQDGTYDLQTYVRYDQYGLYGIKNNSTFKAQSLQDIKDKAHFAVTWDGFFIRNSYTNGWVEITSDNDFRVMQRVDNTDHERIKIGALEFNQAGQPIKYGININQTVYNSNTGQYEDIPAFTTGDDGNVTITGTINATAGNFSGIVNVGSQVPGQNYIVIDGRTGTNNPLIKSSNYQDGAGYGWMINKDGDAVFNNITARGAIKTAVFEYAEIQAVGGVFIFRPSSTIRSAVVSENDLVVTVEKPVLFKEGQWCKISNYATGNNDPDTIDVQTQQIIQNNGLLNVYEISSKSNSTPYEITLQGAAEMIGTVIDSSAELIGGALVDMGNKSGTSNYGIGINSSDNTVNLPARAISLFETIVNEEESLKVSYKYRGIFGTLPVMSNNDVNRTIYSLNMAGTQGIYTDNMYIGDKSHYIAFYTDKTTNTKKLRVAGADVIFTYDDGEGGTTEKTLDERIEEIETEGGQDAAVLVIDSSEGTIFRDNQGQTDLTVTIFYGASVITNKTQLTQSFGIGAYLEWEYKDNTNNWVTLLSSDPRIGDNGFTIHLSAANVYNKANFRCKLVV